jgi:hypothetical protein
MTKFEFTDLPFSSSVKNVKYDPETSKLSITYKGSPNTEYVYGNVAIEDIEEIKRIIVNQYLTYLKNNPTPTNKPELVLLLRVSENETRIVKIEEEFGWILDKLTSLSKLTVGQFISRNIKPIYSVIEKNTLPL